MLLKRLLSEGGLGAALYIDALECITMTNIYERVLAHALAQSAKRSVATRSRSGQSTRPCSTVAEFVTRLAALEWAATEKTFVLIDEPERLLQLDSHAFSVLLRLPELVSRPHTRNQLIVLTEIVPAAHSSDWTGSSQPRTF